MHKIAYNLLFHYKLFRPTRMIDDFTQMKQLVKKDGINYLVIDKDDTLTPVYQYNVKTKEIGETLDELKNQGVYISIVSNSVNKEEKNQPEEKRVHNFDIFLSTFPKPHCGPQLEDLMRLQKQVNPAYPDYAKSKVAVVGDRLLTDIHMANLMGWKSYLVKPLQTTTVKKHGIAVYLLRHFENFLISMSHFQKYVPEKSKHHQHH